MIWGHPKKVVRRAFWNHVDCLEQNKTFLKITRYGVIQKKLFKGHFRIMWTAWSKKSFCNGILGQRTISVQIFKIFGCHQNHGYQTCNMPYLMGQLFMDDPISFIIFNTSVLYANQEIRPSPCQKSQNFFPKNSQSQ